MRRNVTHATHDDVRLRDLIDLMAWPCFALAKRPRYRPIVHEQRDDFVRVSAPASGPALATIWDADVLIWIVSQLAERRDRRHSVSPVLCAPAFQVLRFLGRSTGQSQYDQLVAALDRLTATEVETSLGASVAAPARFHWIERWDRGAQGLTIVTSDWLLLMAIDRRRILRVDPAYLRLTGGIERWLWRLVRRHAHGKSTGWEAALLALHAQSGSLARPADFVADLRRLARKNALPGYTLRLLWRGGEERLHAARSADSVHSAAQVPVDKPTNSSTESAAPCESPRWIERSRSAEQA